MILIFVKKAILLIAKNDYKLEFFANTLFIKFMAHNTYSARMNTRCSSQVDRWNEENKLGFVYDCDTGFRLDSGTWAEPDGAFVSFFKASLEQQLAWKGIANVTPTFLWEMLSNEDDLDKEIAKMEKIWQAQPDFESGLLIDPFTKKYYYYEKTQEKPRICDFSVHFSTSFLPNLIIDNFLVYC
ncbi:MAG: Uma2 family endonuclease [Bacteroidetes bacterium]|nr:MAG: Uma2 family endonuclease [Bacteroidota bacterium]